MHVAYRFYLAPFMKQRKTPIVHRMPVPSFDADASKALLYGTSSSGCFAFFIKTAMGNVETYWHVLASTKAKSSEAA